MRSRRSSASTGSTATCSSATRSCASRRAAQGRRARRRGSPLTSYGEAGVSLAKAEGIVERLRDAGLAVRGQGEPRRRAPPRGRPPGRVERVADEHVAVEAGRRRGSPRAQLAFSSGSCARRWTSPSPELVGVGRAASSLGSRGGWGISSRSPGFGGDAHVRLPGWSWILRPISSASVKPSSSDANADVVDARVLPVARLEDDVHGSCARGADREADRVELLPRCSRPSNHSEASPRQPFRPRRPKADLPRYRASRSRTILLVTRW